MKKLLILALCLIMCVSPLVACGGPDTTAPETTAPETNPPETTYDYDKIPDVIEPHEDKVVTAEELGYQAVVASTEKYWVARASVSKKTGDVTITSLNPGTTVITVKNKYAEKLELTVTVGLDYSIESIEFEKFEMPANYVVATDYGMSPTLEDNAPKLQAAIDAVAAKGGGTVYVPKGIYNSKVVVIKEGVSVRLEGVIENYNAALSSITASNISNSSACNFAVIKAVKGQIGIFINHTPKTRGANGYDNFGFYGGVLDMNGSVRALIWVCAENVTMENVILKDCPNDHAIQITGSKNVTVRDCLFAGYNHGTVYTRETIQIEATTPGAIGGTTSQFDEYEYFHCENVLIENCYFGKSDKYGFHHIPIGHHGHTQKPSVTGLVIRGCNFDNPRIVALRIFGFSNVEIYDNYFLSNQDVAVDGVGRYMIELTFSKGQVKLPSGAYLATEYERGACQNISIYDNEFELGTLSTMSGILTTLQYNSYGYDAKAELNLQCADFYKDKPYLFTGYKMVGNLVSNLRVYDNEIAINNLQKNGMGKSAFYLTGVKGLLIKDNTIESSIRDLSSAKLGNDEIYGAVLSACTPMDKFEHTFVVQAISGNRKCPIVMTGGEADINAFCTTSNLTTPTNLTFSATEGGIINRWAEAGSLFVEPIAHEGYVFDGYYQNGEKLEGDRFEFASATTVEVRFVAAE